MDELPMDGTDNQNFSKDSGAEAPEYLNWIGTQFRPELAFPKLSADMIGRLRSYGQEERFPADCRLYGYGDRGTDLFIVLEGGIDIILPQSNGGTKIYN